MPTSPDDRDGDERSRRQRIPLTSIGWIVAATTVGSYLVGWRLGWLESMIMAAGGLAALLIAVPFVVGRSGIDLVREVEPDRVMRGEPAAATLVARAAGRPSRGVRVDDSIGDDVVVVDIPPMLPGGEHTAYYRLPTDRRRMIEIGPAAVTRRDPLELMRRHVSHAPATRLWVHPRWRVVPALPTGFAKDLEGPTTETSPIGDIAFHALRSYEPGDDRRHIHWMSTARTGTPMVRHYVDNRRPVSAVHLDDDAAVYDDDQFEVAVEVAASLLMSSWAHGVPTIGRAGDRWLAGRVRPASRDQLLERLTTVDATDRGVDADRALAAESMQMVTVERAASAAVVVTGGRSAAGLLPAVNRLSKRVQVIVVTIDGGVRPDTPVARLPGARVVRASDLDSFVAAWTAMVAR